MNWSETPRSWWEGLNRQAFQAKAQSEASRIFNSKIGSWRAINAEMDTPRRTRLLKQDSQDDEW